jgi:hypothetical protein
MRGAAGQLGVAVLAIAGTMALLSVLDQGVPTARVFAGLVVLGVVASLVVVGVAAARGPRRVVRVAVPVFVILIGSMSGMSRYSLMAHGQGDGGAPSIQAVQWAMGMAERHAGDEAPLFVAYDRDSLALGATYPISNDRWYFIFRNQEYTFSIFDSLAGASLWGRGLVATTGDDYTLGELERVIGFQGKAAIMVMWQGEDITPDLRKHLEEHWLVGVAAAGEYRDGPILFSYAILDVVLPEPANG